MENIKIIRLIRFKKTLIFMFIFTPVYIAITVSSFNQILTRENTAENMVETYQRMDESYKEKEPESQSEIEKRDLVLIYLDEWILLLEEIETEKSLKIFELFISILIPILFIFLYIFLEKQHRKEVARNLVTNTIQ